MTDANRREFILPDWPAPTNVKALITTRLGGLSLPPYTSFNLAQHVGDQVATVAANRQILLQSLCHPVQWLTQTHSIVVHGIDDLSPEPLLGDAVTTSKKQAVCAVLTADCLPILLCDTEGSRVAAVHAGWRGLASGIVAQAVRAFTESSSAAEKVLAYLGPAISQRHFQVGEDVLLAFQQAEQARVFSEPVKHSFLPQQEHRGKYLADIYRLARSELQGLGVTRIWGGDFCTVDDDRFYSYRAEGITGRFASLIWMSS